MKLFDDEGNGSEVGQERREEPKKQKEPYIKKEAGPLERLRNLDEKIAGAIDKLRTLKEEKASLAERVKELERSLVERDETINALSSEKTAIKNQIEDLLDELDSIRAD